jgi:predicted nucleotidyltransferase
MSILTQIRSYCSEQDDVLLTYLVGVCHRCTARPDRDYEIAILTRHLLTPERQQKIESDLSRLLENLPVSLVRLHHAGVKPSYTIDVDYQNVFENDLNERIVFEIEMLTWWSTLQCSFSDGQHNGNVLCSHDQESDSPWDKETKMLFLRTRNV